MEFIIIILLIELLFKPRLDFFELLFKPRLDFSRNYILLWYGRGKRNYIIISDGKK